MIFHGGMVASALLGIGLLAPVVADAATVVDQPWGTGCALAWCEPTPAATVDPLADRLGDAAAQARLQEGRGCVDPAGWPAGRIPASMVVTRAGTVERVPFTYPAPEGAWVLTLCRR